MQEVPVKQQWDPWSDEPAATATTKNKPFVDDVDWSDFEKPVQMPSVPVQQPQPFTQIPNQSQYQLQNQTQYQPQNQTQYQPQRLQTESGSKLQTQQQVDSMWGAPLQPTPIEPNKQTFIIAPTQQAKIDKDDPWAVGSHLFSLSNVKEPKGVPFGAAGSTFTSSTLPTTTSGGTNHTTFGSVGTSFGPTGRGSTITTFSSLPLPPTGYGPTAPGYVTPMGYGVPPGVVAVGVMPAPVGVGVGVGVPGGVVGGVPGGVAGVGGGITSGYGTPGYNYSNPTAYGVSYSTPTGL
eukprot:TRINITY_DN1876_c0_g1_i15.p1 TRINITY_DN1876_c0_g1~~TRINITY_DN1876_c0_g1_i15.p1  ORF type:complete len:292 (-),score=93.15 TRINITY_DN1876_c0_g1_i15:74-949(-)